jgi:hypothetical protein
MAFTAGTFGAPLDLDLQLRRPLDLDLHRSEPSLVCSVLNRACGATQGGWSLSGERLMDRPPAPLQAGASSLRRAGERTHIGYESESRQRNGQRST